MGGEGRERVGEEGSFLMELLKIASSNQIRSIKILSVAGAEYSKTESLKAEMQSNQNAKQEK